MKEDHAFLRLCWLCRLEACDPDILEIKQDDFVSERHLERHVEPLMNCFPTDAHDGHELAGRREMNRLRGG